MRESPETSREPVTVRSSDLPLLYALLFVHVAVILALPVATWFIVRFLNSWPGFSKRPLLVPILVGVVALVEVGLYWRTRRVWKRIRGVDLPGMPEGSDPPI